MLNIVVCIKQVPETRDVEVDAETGVLKREGVDSIINPYDLYALETALQMKEKFGGVISAISMGPPQAEIVLREALMMGVDQAYLLSDKAFAGADTLATAYTLAQGISKIGDYQLIICGMQTTDGDTAQVGPGIAEFLDIPHDTCVVSLLDCTPASVMLKRDMGVSIDEIRLDLPCLITVNKGINQPRLLSYRLKMKTKNWPITVWGKTDLGDQSGYFGLTGSPTQVERIFPPESNITVERWSGTGEQLGDKAFNKLKELRFI